MTHTCFLPERFDPKTASDWVGECAADAGWNAEEADRLAACISQSAQAVSERAYHLNANGPVFLKLDLDSQTATLEVHHEGALGDKPCDCPASQVASERVSTNWTDGQLRTHRMIIDRA